MKKAIKIILGVFGLLFAALCVFVLVGAFNPEFTGNLTSGIGKLEEEYRNEELSGTIPGNTVAETENEEELPAASIEAESVFSKWLRFITILSCAAGQKPE